MTQSLQEGKFGPDPVELLYPTLYRFLCMLERPCVVFLHFFLQEFIVRVTFDWGCLCVRFENDRTISFIPPDGEFELMSYRLNTHVKPLIWIESVIERHDHSRYLLKLALIYYRITASSVVDP